MDVVAALRNTKKGQLKYDRYWMEEGRTKEILDAISASLTVMNISPKALALVTSDAYSDPKDKPKWEELKLPSPTRTQTPTKTYSPPDAHFFQLHSEMEFPILEYEEDRLKSIQDIFEAKKREYDNYSHDLQQQIDQQYSLLKRKNELDAKRRAADLQKIQKNFLRESKEKEMQQKEHYQTQAKKLSAKIMEAEMKQKKAEEEIRKREQEQEELLSQLYNCQEDAQNLISKSIEKLNSCEHQSYLKTPGHDQISQLTKLLFSITDFVNQTKTNIINIDDILNASHLVRKTYEAFQEVTNDIDQARGRALHEHEKQYLKQTQKDTTVFNKSLFKEETQMLRANANPDNQMSSEPSTDTKLLVLGDSKVALHMKEKTEKDEKSLLSTFIAPDALEDYYQINKNLKNLESSIEPFTQNVKNKKYKLELQKTARISSVSESNMKDMIYRLLSLLSGKGGEMKGKQLSSDQDSLVHKYCTKIIAKQLVQKSGTLTKSCYTDIIPLSAVIIAVWLKHPDFGFLVLGHLYVQCPYLVPYYPPRQENQSDSDYKKNLGYECDESEHNFLTRMSAFTRLYAAIIQSSLPPDWKGSHPHGISWGWKFITRILNLDPRPGITATILFNFLEVAGHALQKAYGKQFKKFLHVLCKDYLFKIKSVSHRGSLRSVNDLETFIRVTINKGYISPPSEGTLNSGYWKKKGF